MTPVASDPIQIDLPLSERAERTLADDVLDGLTRPFKELPPKHLYDARGSELFERICEQPEYYPTRAETEILMTFSEQIVAELRPVELVELGSGTAEKTRVLLDAMQRAETLERYVPVDVSESTLRACAEQLCETYAGLRVHGVVGDIERHLDAIPDGLEPRIVAFLGGTIGNFIPGSRRRFLRRVGELLGPRDRLLLGTDLVKDPRVLEAAYDDAAGVTAEFNRNMLHVLNRELGADFVPEDFDHVAFFDPDNEWIEMRLRARRAHEVSIPALDLQIRFAAREELRTEISAKFTPERLAADLAAAGLALEHMHTDDEGRYALSIVRSAAC
jgi:L-histidine N-alpha-methyltransferase